MDTLTRKLNGGPGFAGPKDPTRFALLNNLSNQPDLIQDSNSFLTEILKLKGHIGTKHWTKEMSQFLLGSRNDISIFHLEHTFICLRRVLKFLESESRRDSNHILFVNTYRKYSELVQQVAVKSNQSYINDRWIGGMLTNWKQISESILLFKKFNAKFNQFVVENNIQIPIYQKAKRRYNGLDSPLHKASREASPKGVGLASPSLMSSMALPDIIILTNPDQNRNVIQEAKLFKIPIIAFADSNTNVQGIDYIIPGNSKSIYFMYFCLNLITITLESSQIKRP